MQKTIKTHQLKTKRNNTKDRRSISVDINGINTKKKRDETVGGDEVASKITRFLLALFI